MLRSMTGFGSSEGENESYKVHVEIKSVNQRFLDLSFHMPRLFYPWEENIRSLIRGRASRGKMDVCITFLDKREEAFRIRVNRSLARAYHGALNEMSDFLRLPRQDDVSVIASCPEVLSVEGASSLDGCEELLLSAVDKAMEQLDGMRLREGKNIQEDFCLRLDALEDMVKQVSALAPEIVSSYRRRIRGTVEELLAGEGIDEARIIQETALYADKVDYTEEIVRLESHVHQFRRVLEGTGGAMGRKLDFLLQEMNREANTIGAKANNAEAAQLVVEIKSELEKLREQVQNIE